MNKIILSLLSVLAFSSCMQSYNIEGTTNVSRLDGRMLYLKTIADNEMKSLDSCDVVHGKFHFSGPVDSAQIASVYMDNVIIMPIILEQGDISIKIDQTQMTLSGTELNDKLYGFLKSYDSLNVKLADLEHRHYQAILDGSDMEQVSRELNKEAFSINGEMDKLVTGYITDNFDNALGPGVFMIVTGNYAYPEMKPWIMDIMGKATPRFKNDPYVKRFVEGAEHVQKLQNGMESMPNQKVEQTNVQNTNTPASTEQTDKQ